MCSTSSTAPKPPQPSKPNLLRSLRWMLPKRLVFVAWSSSSCVLDPTMLLPMAPRFLMASKGPSTSSKVALSNERAVAVADSTLMVAVRGVLLTNACSPKKAGDSLLPLSLAVSLLSLMTAHSPSTNTYKLSPGAPWVMIISPSSKTHSTKAFATSRRSSSCSADSMPTFLMYSKYRFVAASELLFTMLLKLMRSMTQTTDATFAFTVAARGAK
mmetsp:Transcript_114850/g.365087  ORF Transcript_114850/g.365087 Transcript_114850/m.365087 type:complete len:214 (+) Transcript_114850:500-1141(+)